MTDKTIKEKGHFRSHWVFYSLLALALAAITYVWVDGRYDIRKMTQSHEQEIKSFQAKTDSLLQLSVGQSRILTAKTLGHAISNMNNDQKSQYFGQLITYKGISEIVFENDSKVILASTNAQYLNYSITNALKVKVNYQNTDTQSFYKKGLNLVSQPIIKEGKIDGTMVVVFPSVSVAQLYE